MEATYSAWKPCQGLTTLIMVAMAGSRCRAEYLSPGRPPPGRRLIGRNSLLCWRTRLARASRCPGSELAKDVKAAQRFAELQRRTPSRAQRARKPGPPAINRFDIIPQWSLRVCCRRAASFPPDRSELTTLLVAKVPVHLEAFDDSHVRRSYK